MLQRFRKSVFGIVLGLGLGACVVTAYVGGTSCEAAPSTPAPVALTATGQKLMAKYEAMLSSLQADIAKSVPTVDAAAKAAFLKAWANESSANIVKGELSKFIPATEQAARPVLAQVQSFLGNDQLDAKLVKGAVLAQATPRGLAEFAQQGAAQAALVDQLLSDDALMKEMVYAGGPVGGRYGQAMQIYSAILKASPKAKSGVLQRLAVGTAIGLARTTLIFPGGDRIPMEVNPVNRFLMYQRAYEDGELDPAFPTLTIFDYTHVVDDPYPDSDLVWMRNMLRNYRPDIVTDSDYHWRYCRIVRTDMIYTHPHWDYSIPSKAAYMLDGGGVCGPRAWIGRIATHAFGIPTWGVRQQGHAAMSHWTPTGWVTNFGAAWYTNWWYNACGPMFLMDTQARQVPDQYMKAVRADMVGLALNEEPVNYRKPGSGGFWSALAVAEKRAIVADEEAKAAAQGAAAEPTVASATRVQEAAIPDADKHIVCDQFGWITIPAVACSSPTHNTAKILFMKSWGGGAQLHYNRLGKPEDFEYTVDIPSARRYMLTAHVVTIQKEDQQLYLTVNGAANPLEIQVPYTFGNWRPTPAITISLVQGKNTLRFARSPKAYGISIKDFVLEPVQQ